MKQQDEIYLNSLLTALRCARPETVAALVADVLKVADRPHERDMTQREVNDACDAIYGFGCSLFGNEEFAETCRAAEIEGVYSDAPPVITVDYDSTNFTYVVTYPNGKSRRVGTVRTAVVVAMVAADLDGYQVKLDGAANDHDRDLARILLSGEPAIEYL